MMELTISVCAAFTIFVLVASHEHDVMTSTAACSMPPDTNDCGGREQRWFFHAEVGECREFTYKGCIESANNFASKEACQSVCLAPPSEPEAQPEPDQSDNQKETGLTAAAAAAGTTDDADDSADVDLEALAEEQAELMARFSMADKDDLITLEQYMQDPQMDEAEVLPDDDTDEDVDGIKALYYPNAADVPQEDAPEVVGDDDTSNESTAVTSDEQTPDSTSDPKPATSSTAGDEQTLDSTSDPKPATSSTAGDEHTPDSASDPEPATSSTAGDAKDKTENTAPTDENATDDSLEDDNEDELYDDVIEEQSALQEQYSMADKEDMIELEGLMQDDNMDVGMMMEGSPENEDDAEITGFMYRDVEDDEEQDVEQDAEQDAEQNDVAPAAVVTESPGQHARLESKEDDAIADTLAMEEQIQKQLDMASPEDLLMLEQLLQDENMELGDVIEGTPADDSENDVMEGVMQVDSQKQDINSLQKEYEDIRDAEEEDINREYREHDVTSQAKQADVVVDEADEERQKFRFADDADFITAETLMSDGNLQEMEVVPDTEAAAVNDDDDAAADDTPSIHGTMMYEQYELEPEAADDDQYAVYSDSDYNDREDGVRSDDVEDNEVAEDSAEDESAAPLHSHEVLSEYPVEEQQEIPAQVMPRDQDAEQLDDDEEQVFNAEKRFEERFGMADTNDYRTFEKLVNRPDMAILDMAGKNEAINEQETSDIHGVLSMATSFLAKDDRRDVEGLREHLHTSMQHLGNDDGDRHTEQGQSQHENMVEVRHTTQPMIKLDKASYEDKSMLMTLLHNDMMSVKKIRGASFPKFFGNKYDKKRWKGKKGRQFRNRVKYDESGDVIPKPCRLPKDAGPCKADILQWHFDPFVGTCLPFHYGGCRGNKNRFDTIGACLRKCGDVSAQREKSLPEPEAPPMTPVKPPSIVIKSVVSSFLPKVFKPSNKMTRGSEEFLRMLNGADNPLIDNKPLKFTPIRALMEKEFSNRPPIPLKSVMFKWPIIRMIFDKRAKENTLMPILPSNIESKEAFPQRPELFPAKGKMPPPPPLPMIPRQPLPPPPHVPRNRFAPTFRKDLKVMSQKQDKSHHISSDPRNKVNLIQVFVNKPHNEASAKPEYHHTMIKKHQFSGSDPHVMQHHGSVPARAPSYHNDMTPHRSYPPPPMYQPPPPPGARQAPVYDAQRPVMSSPESGRYSHSHSHEQYHHHHHHPAPYPPPPPHHHHHMSYPPPPSHHHPAPHPQPYYWHQRHESSERFQPHWPAFNPAYRLPAPEKSAYGGMRPSTSYPDVSEPEDDVNVQEVEDTADFEEGTDDNVVVVTVAPGDDDGSEPGYACLLPLSSGMCKAFKERYYYNIESRRCELFFYGGCGGNANNFNTLDECQLTCMRTTPIAGDMSETTTLPDDVIDVTSPVYAVDENEAAAAAAETQATGDEKANSDDDVRGTSQGGSDKIAEDASRNDVMEHETPEHIEVLAEPVSLFRTSHTEYIIILAVTGFVGLSAAALVCLAVANLSRKLKSTKKEKVIEAVIASHMTPTKPGCETPRMVYYGQPPSESGPPPITDIPAVHEENKEEKV